MSMDDACSKLITLYEEQHAQALTKWLAYVNQPLYRRLWDKWSHSGDRDNLEHEVQASRDALKSAYFFINFLNVLKETA